MRIGGEAAHHFQRGDGVLFADRNVAMQAGLDHSLARHVLEVEHIVQHLLARARVFHFAQRLDGNAILTRGGYGNQLAFRVP